MSDKRSQTEKKESLKRKGLNSLSFSALSSKIEERKCRKWRKHSWNNTGVVFNGAQKRFCENVLRFFYIVVKYKKFLYLSIEMVKTTNI
jgi:hypothetical protein